VTYCQILLCAVATYSCKAVGCLLVASSCVSNEQQLVTLVSSMICIVSGRQSSSTVSRCRDWQEYQCLQSPGCALNLWGPLNAGYI